MGKKWTSQRKQKQPSFKQQKYCPIDNGEDELFCIDTQADYIPLNNNESFSVKLRGRRRAIKEDEEDDVVTFEGFISGLNDEAITGESNSDTESAEEVSSSCTDDDDKSTATSTSTTATDSDELLDEDFAKLVVEYRHLMNPNSRDMEWSLDENAERMLRERKLRDPKYSHMSREEFENVISFDEVYGTKLNNGAFKRKQQLGVGGKVKASTAKITFKDVNFKQLNREIKEFVRHEEGGEEMELEPYSPMIRKLVHQLAHMYGLASKSSGQGVERHCVLVKGSGTMLPRDLKRLDRFLEGAQKAARFATKHDTSSGCGGKKKSNPVRGNDKGKGKSSLSGGSSAKVTPGTVVGSEAAPIEEDNIGNMMLRKLGWKPGHGLGSDQDGLKEPISAIFRGNRVGLGS